MDTNLDSHSLGVKYRPTNFDSFLGNDRAGRSLSTGLVQGKLGSSLLLVGETGAGKTTLAIMIAKAVNCAHPAKDGSPCNKCESCLDGGGAVYVDCVNNGSKEDVTKLVSAQRMRPVYKRRVVILDEAHALSRAANGSATALLAAMESEDYNTLWIACTNLPDRLLPTLRSRCTTYNLTAPSRDDFINYCLDVIQDEWGKFPGGEDATAKRLSRLYDSVGGLMREGLNNLPLLVMGGDLDTVAGSEVEGDTYIEELLAVMLSDDPVRQFDKFVKAVHGLRAAVSVTLNVQITTMRAVLDNLIAYSAGASGLYNPVAKALQRKNNRISLDNLMHATLALSEAERHMKDIVLSPSAERSVFVSAVMLYLDKARS